MRNRASRARVGELWNGVSTQFCIPQETSRSRVPYKIVSKNPTQAPIEPEMREILHAHFRIHIQFTQPLSNLHIFSFLFYILIRKNLLLPRAHNGFFGWQRRFHDFFFTQERSMYIKALRNQIYGIPSLIESKFYCCSI